MELVALAVLACGVMVGSCVLRVGYLLSAALDRPEPAPYEPPAPATSYVYPEQRRRPVSAPQRVK